MTGAHRLAYQLIRGNIVPGHIVMHSCDNKTCVRPSHLRAGTQKENIEDMIRKGRQARGAALNHPPQAGEQNHASKLTADTVKRIRAMWAEGRSQAAIVAATGVKRPNVWAIVHRKSWSGFDASVPAVMADFARDGGAKLDAPASGA